MNPIDEVVCEEKIAARGNELVKNFPPENFRRHVQEYGKEKVGPTIVLHIFIQHGITSDFSKEPRQREQHHARERLQTAYDLLSDLVFEEAGMFHHFMVENEEIRQGSENEIEDMDAN